MVDEKELVRMYKAGATHKQIRAHFGCGHGKVYRVLKKHGVPRVKTKTGNRQRILDAYKVGPNIAQVATSLNLSTQTVHKHLHAAGVDVLMNVRTGPEHHNWKGGVTSDIEKLRHTDEYQQWRRLVYARDGWKCRVCGNNDTIHAHHIVPVSDDQDLYASLDNGITLCLDCHAKTLGKESEFAGQFRGLIAGATIDSALVEVLTRLPDQPQPCACGCGQMTKVIHGRANRFIHGHSRRGRGMKASTKAKLRKAGVFFAGIEVDPEDIRRMYVDQKMRVDDVSAALGCSNAYVLGVLKERGWSRTRSEAQRLRYARCKG